MRIDEIHETMRWAIDDVSVSLHAMRWTPDEAWNPTPQQRTFADRLRAACEDFPPSRATRADAITAGDLIPVNPATAREAGFTVPVALTRSVWEDCVAWTEEDDRRKQHEVVQDEQGRLWDVIWMAGRTAIEFRNASTTGVRLYRIPRTGRGKQPRLVTLTMTIAPGDAGEPVITIMRRDEYPLH